MPLAQYSYSHPFLQPFPIWNYWYMLLLPLVVGTSIVYKSIKCNFMREVPKAALVIVAWIILGMVAAGGVLAGIVKFVER